MKTLDILGATLIAMIFAGVVYGLLAFVGAAKKAMR